MKIKAIAFILLLCLLAPALLTQLWFDHQKYIVRKQVKRQIIAGVDRDELILLTFHKSTLTSDLRWEHSKEFEYQGEMYDIVSAVDLGDSIQYYCWWDQKETALNRKLDRLAASAFNHNPLTRESNDRFQHYLSTLYFEKQAVSLWLLPSTEILCSFNLRWCSLCLPPPAPPPRRYT